MIVSDSARKFYSYDIQNPIFEGGEGRIFVISGHADRLIKIFKPEKRAGHVAKLTWMIANPPYDPGHTSGHSAIAWPETLLYDQRQFVGYVMPRIENTRTLLHVINPRLRAQVLPGFDWRYLHRSARNLAAAIHALHTCDYIIGDLNETNVLVAPNALVTVIDADSFQVKEERDGRAIFYPCPVGRPEYTPPELQGKPFQEEIRQPYHDDFALAVLIFQLLMGGNHPFRAVWKGSGEPPPVQEKIYRGWFPYMPVPRGPVKPPPHVSIEHLSPILVKLMRRCFVDGYDNPTSRPSSAEWESALKEAENKLLACSNGHIYADHLDQCPQCYRKKQSLRRSPLPTHASVPIMLTSHGTILCPRCGTDNPGKFVYCKSCNIPLYGTNPCPHCGRTTARGPQAKFCSKCGRQLSKRY